MKRPFAFGPSVLLLVACGGAAPPVTSPAPPVASTAASTAEASSLDCTSSATEHDHVTLHADLSTMTGTVAIDGQGTRRLRAKVTPYAGTYLFMFSGYAPGDQKPSSENLVVGTSIVARLVTIVDDTIPYFDGEVALHDAGGKKIESLRKCAAPAK